MLDITVITPSIPGRSAMLSDACASVAAQIFPPATHLIGIDHRGRGPAVIRNELITAADTEWIAFLDDDDLLDEDHLGLLAANSDGHDVVISYCRFEGPPLPPKYCNRPYDREALGQHGIFPITVLARRSALLAAGGFGSERWEDWSLFNRLADRGGRFNVIPQISWTYRRGHGCRTDGTL